MTFVDHLVVWIVIAATISEVVSQETRSSILDNKPIRVQDYGTPPVTSTIPLYDCSSSHRPKVDIPGAFEVYHDKQWYMQSCQEGLTWNQSVCRCEFPNGDRLVVQCRDYRATSDEPTGKYEQLVNSQWIVRDCSLAVAGLVWDQVACQCVWGPGSKEMVTGQGIAPCEIMLNMTFENGVKDDGKGSFVEVGRGNPVPVFAVNKRGSVDGYKAAYFTDTALNIWYFAGNEMGTSLRVEFRFKMTNDPIQRDKYQIFLSNGCNVSAPGYTTPSLAIGYRAADQSYLLAFETASARKAIVCTRKLGAYDWHTVSLIYEDGTLLFRVDDNPCIISQDFSGPVQKTPCPLTIGADPLERESMYKGYLDNILIARYCRRFVDTDPKESTDKSKGPMPVETAPNVVDIGFQQGKSPDRASSLGKAVTGRQRSITSSKYFSEIPTEAASGSEHSDKTNKEREPRVKSPRSLSKTVGSGNSPRSLSKTVGSGNSPHRSLNPSSNNNGHGQGQHGSWHEQRSGDIIRDGSSGHGHGHSISRRTSGQSPGYSKDDKTTEPKDGPTYSDNGGGQKTGYGRSDDGGDLVDDYGDGGKTVRDGNDDDSLGENDESDNVKRMSGGEKDGGLTRIVYVEGYLENNGKKNEQSSSDENAGGYINNNSGNSKQHGHIEETNNKLTNSDHNSRHENRFDSSEKATNINEGRSRTRQQYGNRGQGNPVDSSQKTGGEESGFENSRGKNSGLKSSRNSGSFESSHHNTQKSSGHASNDKGRDNGGDIDKTGSDEKYVNTNSETTMGYFNNNKDNSETVVDYPGPGKRGQFVHGSTNELKADSSSSVIDDENVDYVSPDKDTDADSDNDDDHDDKGQSKNNENLQSKEYTNRQNKNYQNIQNDDYGKKINKEYENSQNREFSTGQNKQYQTGKNKEQESGQNREYHTEQNKQYQTGKNKEQESGQNREYHTEQNKQYQNGQSREFESGKNREYENGHIKERVNGRNNNNNYNRQANHRIYHTSKNKEYKNGENKNYGNGQNREYDNRKSNEYGGAERSKRSENTGPLKRTEHGQAYTGNIDSKLLTQFAKEVNRPIKNAKHSVMFEESERLAFSTHPTTRVNIETKLTKPPTSSKVSSYRKIIVDGSRKDNTNIESLEGGKHETTDGKRKMSVKIDHDSTLKRDTPHRFVEDDWNKDTPLDVSTKNGLNQISNGTAANLVKGNRRFGSKKTNWYDKADLSQGNQKVSLKSDKIDKLTGKLDADKSDAVRRSKVITEPGHVTGPGTRIIFDYSNGKSSPSSPRQDDAGFVSHQKVYTPKEALPWQRSVGKGFATPSHGGYVIKQIDENYGADYDSNVDDVSEDDIVNQSLGSLDERTQSAKGEPYTNNKIDLTIKSIEKSPEQTKTSVENTSTSEKVHDGKPDSHLKSGADLQSQVIMKTSLPPTKPMSVNSDLDEKPTSRLDMPVDVTKSRIWKPSDPTSGTTVGRAVVSTSPLVSGGATIVEKVRV